MRLFDIGFGKINELVNACADYAIDGIILYGSIGIGVGLFIVVSINFIPFLRPKSRFFKVINLFNFVYFPALFGVVLGGYGGIRYTEKYVKKQVKETVVPMTKLSFPAFQIYLASEVDIKDTTLRLEDVVSDFTGVINFKPKDNSWLEVKKADIANAQVPKAIGWGIQSIVDVEIEERGYTNVRRIDVANHMSFFKLKYSFWRAVEVRTLQYADHYFMQQYMKLLFLSIGMGSLLFFQLMVFFLRPKL